MHKCRLGAGLVILLVTSSLAQPASDQKKASSASQSAHKSAPVDLKQVLQTRVKAEWEALKTRNKKAYGDLLADDFVAVEDDGNGERNKIQAIAEIDRSNIFNYAASFFDLLPLAPDVAFVRYEVTMQFPPKAVVRYKRVLATEIWLKRGGEWKLCRYQETRVK